MASAQKCSYDLAKLKALVQAGSFFITSSALTDAMALGLDRTDIATCVLSLDSSDFYKTMPANNRPGLMQDVYKPNYMGDALYVKVQIDSQAVVVSFKEE